MSIAVNIDSANLHRSQSGAVWGPIWLEANGIAFPVKGWSDIVAPLLHALLDGLNELQKNPAESQQVWFMDGPYFVELSCDAGILNVRMFRDDSSGLLLHGSAEASFGTFISNVAAAANELLATFEHRGWIDRDYRALRTKLAESKK
jgi:hypothetical protein